MSQEMRERLIKEFKDKHKETSRGEWRLQDAGSGYCSIRDGLFRLVATFEGPGSVKNANFVMHCHRNIKTLTHQTSLLMGENQRLISRVEELELRLSEAEYRRREMERSRP